MGYVKFQSSITKEYGPVVGYYLGFMPFVTVTDVEILKHILVKDFDSFQDRPYTPVIIRAASAPQDLLDARGEEWKTARHTLSPSFSAAKMKAMVPLLQKSVESLGKIIDESADANQSVEVYKLYGNFTMETILATAFGRSVDIQGGESDQIVDISRMFFDTSKEENALSHTMLMPVLNSFPWLESILRLLVSRSVIVKNIDTLHSIAKELVSQRRDNPNPQKYKDLLQLMIDATTEDQQRLTDEQIVTHSVIFLLAGYETTSTALAYVSYMLALNPTVQEKLQQEIDNYFDNNPEAPLYEAAQEIEYLEKVILETLRLYSPAGSLLRYCQKTTVINGVTFPKGVSVDVPIHLIHKDPQHWPNPEDFDPERFSPEEKSKRPPLSYIPFGYGPRNCIGMRLALLEAKLALIHLLRRFTFIQAPDTEVPLETTYGITVAPKNGVFLKIARRN
ncbi:cytochrome P450 3A24-like isoform X2 [Halichondria panicea]